MAKPKELRDQSVEELELLHENLRKERFELMNESRQTRNVEKPHRLRLLRRDIARTLTVLKEKQAKEQTA